MPISLIACVVKYRNKLVIGKDNDLLVKLPKDIEFFKNITSNKIQELPNIVLMGRHTYYSIPSNYRPLKNRLNFVLTNDPGYLKSYPLPKHLKDLSTNKVYFLTLLQFENFYKMFNPNVFVIGGGQVYNLFLNNKEFTIEKLYITEVKGFVLQDYTNLITMPHFDYRYKFIGYSEKYTQNELSYRILTYNYLNEGTEEQKYLNVMTHILKNGNKRINRTGINTISIFGNQIKFDISQNIPLMTSKSIPFKTICEELLWMCRGDTDAKILEKKGIKIWSSNTSREFLDKQNLQNYPVGVLGAGYGFQWRHFGAKYSPSFADTSKCDTSKIGGVDQLKYIEDLLQNDPFSRRIMISAWNPTDFKNTALVPCHYSIQFYVTEENNERYLSCMFIMRSSDFDTAACYNCTAYSLLTYILAKKYNFKPKELIFISGDTHIYENHFDQVKEQLSRTPRPLPKISLDNSIITKDWQDITVDDFELIGYFPQKYIPIKMAI
jgi:thymidylate synthase